MTLRPTRRPLVLPLALAAGVALGSLAACTSDSSEPVEQKPEMSVDPTTTAGKGSGGEPGSSMKGETRLDQVWKADQVDGPISGGKYGIPYLAMPEGWAEQYGYTEEEYFLSGDAVSYGSQSGAPLTADGEWDIQGTSATAPYKTRIVVRRPEDPADFNGTVVVEWLNVTAGRDSDPDFGFLAPELMGKGYAYVAVSAQQTGVEPGGLGMDIPGVPEEALAPLKDWDPERYSSLAHPGDQYSYDIFSQAARTAVEPDEDLPLGDLDVQRVIAVGESQSASRLVSYANGVQPLTGMFDGFLIHSRGSSGTPFDDGSGDDQSPPPGTHIRKDLGVPVMQFTTETDLDFLGFVKARQDDTADLVTWETAGTAHADRSTLDYGVEAGRRWTDANVDLSTTCGQVNEGPQTPIVQKAFDSLATWVETGEAPPSAPRLAADADGVLERDADGIAIGGIRTPAVDAPIAVHTGKNPSDDVICVLFGSTTPFTQAQLDAHYPDHDAYVAAVTKSADQAVADGYLLESTAQDLIAEAEASDIP